MNSITMLKPSREWLRNHGPMVNSTEWRAQSIRMPTDSKLAGNFSLDLFPWMSTLFECFDDPDIGRIALQSAAQLGKTTFASGCIARAAANNPHPMCWAEPDKHSLERVIGRLWRMFERTQSSMPAEEHAGITAD